MFNSGRDVDDNQRVPDNATDDDIQELVFNSPITDDEIKQSMKSVNANKFVSGTLIPEHLIYGIHVLLPFIHYPFTQEG